MVAPVNGAMRCDVMAKCATRGEGGWMVGNGTGRKGQNGRTGGFLDKGVYSVWGGGLVTGGDEDVLSGRDSY